MENEKHTPELLPCPFCGNMPNVQRNRTRGISIFCGYCDCSFESIKPDDDEDTIAAWNRRAPDAHTRLIDELMRALEASDAALLVLQHKEMSDEARADVRMDRQRNQAALARAREVSR